MESANLESSPPQTATKASSPSVTAEHWKRPQDGSSMRTTGLPIVPLPMGAASSRPGLSSA